MTTAQLIQVCGEGHRSILPDGKAKGLSPSNFSSEELSKGIRVEREHTSSNKVACAIAMDHLAEDARYYTKLAKIHLDDEDEMRKRKSLNATEDTKVGAWLAVIGGIAVVGLIAGMVKG